jgi:hypothetical protein
MSAKVSGFTNNTRRIGSDILSQTEPHIIERLNRLLLFLVLFCSSLDAVAQGEIVFNNRITNILIAPIYGLESSAPGLVQQGNTTAGTPAGTQNYHGPLLAGNDYTAQLFGGPTNSADENLSPLSPAANFRTASSAGFIEPPAFAIRVPGVPEGQPAKIQLRAWPNAGGAITNWQQVLANPNIPRGKSLAFISPPLGGLFVAPPNLLGLRSFNLALPNAPTAAPQFVSSLRLTNGNFQFSFNATTNLTYSVQASIDLTDWQTIATNIFVPSSPWTFEETNAAGFVNRFYQIRWP